MMTSLIVAMSKNRVIGINNEMPWYLSDDFKNFKKLTLNKTIVMGRKTFESIGKPLPQRTNVVLTRDPNFVAEGVLTRNSIDQVREEFSHKDELVFIGGGTIYDKVIELVDIMYITMVDVELEGDTFFPEFVLDRFEVTDSFSHSKDAKNDYDWEFRRYQRKT